MRRLKDKGDSENVECSEDDGCLFGKVTGMNNDIISGEGNTVGELKADFEAGVDLFPESCKEQGN